MIPLVAPTFFAKLIDAYKPLKPLLESGILLTSLAAVVLNMYFNGVGSADEARSAAARTTHGEA